LADRNLERKAETMKLLLRLIVVVSLLSLSGCTAGSSAPQGPSPTTTPAPQAQSDSENGADDQTTPDNRAEVVEISEKLFVAQSNDVYLNPDDYLGKTIRYEGVFVTFEYPEEVFHTVIRYGPGCCGIDQNCGFEVVWHDGQEVYVNEGDWVRVTGVLEDYDAYGYQQLRLSLISLEVLEVRGAEYVTQ
jgi:uncharacterized membrane protein YcgQ (UPF0703/DUF1980 family)